MKPFKRYRAPRACRIEKNEKEGRNIYFSKPPKNRVKKKIIRKIESLTVIIYFLVSVELTLKFYINSLITGIM